MSTVNPISAGSSEGSYLSRIPTQTLDQQDFLKLLVAQMTSQDPMSPKKDTDFFAQMATFSSLEQAKIMQADIAALRLEQQMLHANSLLGRTVNIRVDDSTLVTGVVSAVHMEAGTPKVVVGDAEFDLKQVAVIAPTF